MGSTPESGNKPRPRIKLSRDGPYLVAVDDLENSKGERLEGKHGVALCRCGASGNKPFCDGSHIRIGFSDERRTDQTIFRRGEQPRTQPQPANAPTIIETMRRCPSGALRNEQNGQGEPGAIMAPRIRIAKNGPYEVTGFDLDTEHWREGASRGRYTLCRCGGSRTKPFCDGTHRLNNFLDDRN